MGEHPPTAPLIDREISWLAFSHRVLQEAADPTVPLFERLFFCGIFSSNLDEYFRVRVASLRSLLRLPDGEHGKLRVNPHRLLHDIHRLVLGQQEEYGGILGDLIAELRTEGIHLVDHEGVPPRDRDWLRDYFTTHVAGHLSPAWLHPEDGSRPFLLNRRVYLVVEVWPADDTGVTSWRPEYALVEVPSPPLDRFVVLPGPTHRVMYLDDVIRFNLGAVFPGKRVGRAYAVKLTRDAELHLDDEFEGDLADAIRQSLGNRETGVPSRFLYDMRTPYVLVHTLQHELGLADEDLVVGGRYHNLNDLMGFPRFGRDDLSYPAWPPLPHPVLDKTPSIFEAVATSDQVVHTPYQSFDHVVRFLEESAGDPQVEEVWLTVYRVARDSAVLNALLKAAAAGKRVTVFMEVQARFDEEANLEWGERLSAAGARTLYSMPGLKVHAKIALVARREGASRTLYAYVGTGNFNEKTARTYTDHGVLTRDPRIADDVEQVFRFLTGEIERPDVKHLLVAPFNLREGFTALLDAEAAAARAGRPSGVTLKMNALEDARMAHRLHETALQGVPVQIVVRGICTLGVGGAASAPSVEARSILDRYLEHSRIYRFHAEGEDRMYLASADWMTRNLSRRVEVALPVYDPDVRAQLTKVLELQLADDTRARLVTSDGTNPYAGTTREVRAQEAFREYLAGRGSVEPADPSAG